jgi:hypothetical protein
MYKYFLFACLLFTTLVSAQINNAEPDVPWTIGVGVNIVDNDGFKFSQPFTTKNWNFKNPISVNIERKIDNFWSANLAITLNTLEQTNKHNNGFITEDSNLFAVDVTGRYTYDQLFMDTPRIDPFEAYVLTGIGYTSVSGLSYNTATFNIGLGFNIWIIQDFGLRLQTMGKFGSKKNQYLNNYLQHTAEFIVRF